MTRRPRLAPGPVVVFDVGETLVDETPQWTEWARWLNVPTFTFFALIGGMIAQGRSHQDAVTLLRPATDLEGERAAMLAARRARPPDPPRLYPDAEPCLRELARRGVRVVVGGNQPAAFRRAVEELDLPVFAVTSSADLGAAKPSPEFFERVAAVAGVAPEHCVHVGDRLDNDVIAARAAGMTPVWLRRGPWAHLQTGVLDHSAAAATVEDLSSLPDLLGRLDLAGR